MSTKSCMKKIYNIPTSTTSIFTGGSGTTVIYNTGVTTNTVVPNFSSYNFVASGADFPIDYFARKFIENCLEVCRNDSDARAVFVSHIRQKKQDLLQDVVREKFPHYTTLLDKLLILK